MSERDYLTIAEAAALLNLTPAGVRKAIQMQRITPTRFSQRVVLVARAEVERYRNERRPRGWPAGRPRRTKDEA